MLVKKPKRKQLTKEKIGREICYLLDLPYGNNSRVSEGYRIAQRVIDVITSALLRGEEVSIAGFGIFRPHTIQSRRGPVSFFRDGKMQTSYVTTYPTKKTFRFEPSKVLLR